MKVYFHKNDNETDVITVVSKNELNINQIPIEQLSTSFNYLGSVQELVIQPFKKINKSYENGVILKDNQPILDKINAKTILDWRRNAINDQFRKHLFLDLPIFQ
jgi:hypothetical protein